MTRQPRIITQGLALVLAASMARFSSAAPADIFQSPAPALGKPPKEASASGTGGASVGPQNGTAGYVYGLALPPGRNDMAPSLQLSYNSSGPVRGTLAAGWSLAIPSIEVDTSVGIAQAEPRYVSSISEGYLVGVPEPARLGFNPYRAYRDAGDVRYQYSPTDSLWIAMTTDGVTRYFGETPESRNAEGSQEPTKWMLTRSVDPYGNEVNYQYEHVSIAGLSGVRAEPRLVAIEYSQNQAAGIPSHARVEMDWWTDPPTCASGSSLPIGAKVTGRRGALELEGASWLARIRVFVRQTPSAALDTLVHEWSLSYDYGARSCTGNHSPLRILQSITEYAYREGVQQSKPPVTFEYGALYTERGNHKKDMWATSKLAHLGVGERLGRTQKPYSDWSGVSAQLIDYNGDGRLDLMYQAPSTSWKLSGDKKSCRGTVYTISETATQIARSHCPPCPGVEAVAPSPRAAR